jgi:hypothetical protein
MASIRYPGAKGTLIRESLKSKISCQTPFKLRMLAYHFCFYVIVNE